MEIVISALKALAIEKEWGLIIGLICFFVYIINRVLSAEQARDETDLDREKKLIGVVDGFREYQPVIASTLTNLVNTAKSLNDIVEANTKTTALLVEKVNVLTEEVKQHAEKLDEHGAAIRRLEEIQKGNYVNSSSD